MAELKNEPELCREEHALIKLKKKLEDGVPQTSQQARDLFRDLTNHFGLFITDFSNLSGVDSRVLAAWFSRGAPCPKEFLSWLKKVERSPVVITPVEVKVRYEFTIEHTATLFIASSNVPAKVTFGESPAVQTLTVTVTKMAQISDIRLAAKRQLGLNGDFLCGETTVRNYRLDPRLRWADVVRRLELRPDEVITFHKDRDSRDLIDLEFSSVQADCCVIL